MSLKFVSYSGKYPNLCSGTLVLAIDGVEIIFPSHCLSSGGRVYFDNEWNAYIESGEWDICEYPDGFPDSLKEDAVRLVNENVRYGCCGGCI